MIRIPRIAFHENRSALSRTSTERRIVSSNTSARFSVRSVPISTVRRYSPHRIEPDRAPDHRQGTQHQYGMTGGGGEEASRPAQAGTMQKVSIQGASSASGMALPKYQP